MRILLAQNMPHVPAYGGANRSNRIMLEQLAARGHECHVVAPGDPREYELAGVWGHAVPGHRLVGQVRQVAAALRPDWVLVPSDDPGDLMLGAALTVAPGRVVYLAHTLQRLPFGPGAFRPSRAGTALVRRAAGVVAVSRAAQDYLRSWGGLDSHLIYPAVYGAGPFARGDGGRVTMVNPCGYKGLAIFLALAAALPDVPFLAVASWGTGTDDRRLLARQSNVEVMEAVDNIDDVLRRTRVMVVPSLWDETFGYTAVEAMLRGIPVLASDVGGLREAKLGVPYLIPVNPIERYDTTNPVLPDPVVPDQDLTPWRVALTRLLEDGGHHRALADRSRSAATAFVAGLDPGALETFLYELSPAAPTPTDPTPTDPAPADPAPAGR